MPTPNLQNQSSHEVLFNQKPNTDSIKEFGHLCYPWPYTKHKLQPKLTTCIYLGFNNKHHCHQYFDPIASKALCLYLSRDAIFFETNFPFTNIFSSLSIKTSYKWDATTTEIQLAEPFRKCKHSWATSSKNLETQSQKIPIYTSTSPSHGHLVKNQINITKTKSYQTQKSEPESSNSTHHINKPKRFPIWVKPCKMSMIHLQKSRQGNWSRCWVWYCSLPKAKGLAFGENCWMQSMQRVDTLMEKRGSIEAHVQLSFSEA